MGTAVSPVEVCNLSLDLLRHTELVEDIETPETDTEALCQKWYDVTRRSRLRAFPFNFARKRTSLSLNATAPSFGYTDAYNLPNDYLDIVFVGENYDEDYELEYAVEGGQILINNEGAATLKICYVCDFTNVVKFDPLFLDLFTVELAIRLANRLTGVNKSMAGLITWKKELEAQARAKNGQENPVKVRSRSPLITRRSSVVQGTFDGTHLLS